MKITFKKFLMLSFIVGGAFYGTAQTKEQRERIIKNYDLNALKELSTKFETEFFEKKAKAESLAKINNWPLSYSKEGSYAELMDVTEEGNPIYYSTYNVGSALTSRANHLQPGGSLGLNLTGSGMYVGVWDGKYPRTSHVDFVGRFTTQDGPGTQLENHPTHVLGTIIGAGAQNANAKGIASEAYGYINDFNNDMGEMTLQASFGLLLSNHSYGPVAAGLPAYFFGAYTGNSRSVDLLTFNAPSYQPVVAAGNDGDGNYDHLTSMATAKNTIVVAAVNQVSNYTGASSVSLAGFSSWGPTDDNRVKPDISSKGVAVVSATFQTDISYGPMQGTSMAAPGVTGALLLLQQHFSNLNAGNYMLSSTVRGLVAHSADEAGAFDGPDSKFGWGLMNAKKAAEAISRKGTESVIREATLLPNQSYTFNVLALGTEPVIATLSWTDPAGATSNGTVNNTTPVLVNDLDVRVTKDGVVNFPWKLGNSLAAAAVKGDNTVDNIEKVEVLNPAGIYTITVTHKGATLSNPKAGGVPSQDYSLIVTGIDADAVLSTDSFASESFKMWPNPASNILNISMKSSDQLSSFSIYDIQGREVLSGSLNATENQISTATIGSGVYIVTVKNEESTISKKLIVK